MTFERVLVANRGEIALRVVRALRELEIESVAVFSEADADAPHVRAADQSILVGPPPSTDSYLRPERLLAAAAETGADGVHPGYGFLAESANFARAVEDAGMVWIGPPPRAIERMGSKTDARALMQAAGVPIVPGAIEPAATVEQAERQAEAIGWPVAVKAIGGGGGKGFRVAANADALPKAFDGAAGEGARFFGDSRVYLERYLEDPRHVEVQILADAHGAVLHLGERDCSVQRRHQKLIEEAPAPTVDDDLRGRIGEIAVQAARAVDYRGAGTVEGLLADGQFYFLEMNTRIQVEHCVTEALTGIDLVREQIRIAAGHPLSLLPSELVLRGHVIECRINAEDARRGFAPSPGRLETWHEPSGPGVRVDSGVRQGMEVSSHYDPLLAKLVVWDVDRRAATRRMRRALAEFEVDGVRTLVPFHRALLASEQWANGQTCRDLISDRAWLKSLPA